MKRGWENKIVWAIYDDKNKSSTPMHLQCKKYGKQPVEDQKIKGYSLTFRSRYKTEIPQLCLDAGINRNNQNKQNWKSHHSSGDS